MGRQSKLNRLRREERNSKSNLQDNSIKNGDVIKKITRQVSVNELVKAYTLSILKEGHELANKLIHLSPNVTPPEDTRFVLSFVIHAWSNKVFYGVCFIHDVRFNAIEDVFEYNYSPLVFPTHIPEALNPDLVVISKDITAALHEFMRDFVSQKGISLLYEMASDPSLKIKR